MAPIVKVKQGLLMGKTATTPSGKQYFSFQGIPYAKPPIGPLRFKAPQPHDPWQDIRDATSEGSVSPQIDIVFSKTYVGDENCLFLNVYTPSLERTSLPVMFWIHGGGLFYGSGNTDFYGPDYLVEKDVIIVTVNYRLGPFGFLCLDTPEVPGNAALKDIVLALRWVKENIQNFGGDPENVTVFGESAGSAIASILTASPLTKDLFSRVILQSGNALPAWVHNKKPIALAQLIAKALGCEAENEHDIFKFLSVATAKEIVEAQQSLGKTLDESLQIFAFVEEKEFPGVEAFITEPFVDLLESGKVDHVPIIIGTTTLEFGYEKTSEDFHSFIPSELNVEKDSESALAIIEDMKTLYFKDGEESLFEYCQLISDSFINVSHHRYIQYLVKSTNMPVYYYKFDYVGELNISDTFQKNILPNKSMHGDELGYLFNNDVKKDAKPSPRDIKMREVMVRLWTNFAKTGNPTPEYDEHINVIWRPATEDNEYYLHIAQELIVSANYDKEKMDFWDSLFDKYLKTNVQGLNTKSVQLSRSNKVFGNTKIAEVSKNNGVPDNVIRANDLPENDLPKNIEINKFVKFYESLSNNK